MYPPYEEIEQMVADRDRGLTWGQLSIKYKHDPNNIRRSVLRYKNETRR
jgi:hypothetical protein